MPRGHPKSDFRSPGIFIFRSNFGGCMSDDYEIFKIRLHKYARWNGRCLESTYKARSQSGYAIMKYKKTTIGAHRMAWMVHYGEIPKGMWVLHKCDNPICININHLWLGYPKDNTADMIRKKRDNMFGQRIHSNLKVERAIALRKKGVIYREIAEQLNVSIHTINSFFRRKSVALEVKDFYAKPKYSMDEINQACELRRNGVSCREIQKILGIPKRTLTRIFNKHYK